MPAKKSTLPAVQLSLDGARPKKPAAAKKAARARQAASGRARAASGKARATSSGKTPATGEGKGEAARFADALHRLERLSESLHFTHESFALSLLRLPRAEDYEPLTGPLQRLAAATPDLLRSLDESSTAPPAASVATAASAVATARDHLLAALDRLPQAADYEPAARNLRAMASVSPSLMDWLSEVPALAAPLAESVTDLRSALDHLDRALELLPEGLAASEPARGRARSKEPRVRVIVRG